ncbi:MAG: RHS repeat-associated core domain-containing protein [Acidimicrobiales bacterium]
MVAYVLLEHASAPFSRFVTAAATGSERFCTSSGINYEQSVTNASDGSIDRYYDPSTEQFVSVDPLVAVTQAPYYYVEDDPVNESDPNGLCVKVVFVCIGGGPETSPRSAVASTTWSEPWRADRHGPTGSFWGRVMVNGQTIEYRAYTLPNRTINIGIYHVAG